MRVLGCLRLELVIFSVIGRRGQLRVQVCLVIFVVIGPRGSLRVQGCLSLELVIFLCNRSEGAR